MAVKSLTPNLMVEDVARSREFWCGFLGLRLNMCVDAAKGFHQEPPEGAELIWAQFVADGVEFMVQRRDSLASELPRFAHAPTGGGFTLYLQVDDLDARVASLASRVSVVKDVHVTFYGMREWYIQDPDGYVVCLAQPAGR